MFPVVKSTPFLSTSTSSIEMHPLPSMEMRPLLPANRPFSCSMTFAPAEKGGSWRTLNGISSPLTFFPAWPSTRAMRRAIGSLSWTMEKALMECQSMRAASGSISGLRSRRSLRMTKCSGISSTGSLPRAMRTFMTGRRVVLACNRAFCAASSCKPCTMPKSCNRAENSGQARNSPPGAGGYTEA